MQFTKVRGIAGRADEKGKTFSPERLSRWQEGWYQREKPVWKYFKTKGPSFRRGLPSSICMHQQEQQATELKTRTWNMIWVCDGLRNRDKRALRYEPAKMLFTPTLWPWAVSVYVRWVVSSTTNRVQIQTAIPLWESTSEDTTSHRSLEGTFSCFSKYIVWVHPYTHKRASPCAGKNGKRFLKTANDCKCRLSGKGGFFLDRSCYFVWGACPKMSSQKFLSVFCLHFQTLQYLRKKVISFCSVVCKSSKWWERDLLCWCVDNENSF